MKTNKNHTSKTTFKNLNADMKRWYGKNWLRNGFFAFFLVFICPILVNFFA